MKFVIQRNLLNENQLNRTFDAVKSFPHVLIDMKPFHEEIFSDDPLDGFNYIPYGSTLFTLEASKRGWRGLSFDLDMLNYETFLKNHPNMLNDNVLTVAEAIEFLKKQDPNKEWFTRPSKDLKQFSGQVIKSTELWLWLESMTLAVGGGSYYMPPDEKIVLSSPKNVQAEWRWFIVGGKIVSGSMYRAHNQLRKLRELDSSVINEAQTLADIWLPHECVVMDTALVDGKVCVVEFNCINSSGFYDNDVPLIFSEWWKHYS